MEAKAVEVSGRWERKKLGPARTMHIATRGQTNLSFLLPHSFSTLSLGFFLLVYAFLVRCSRYCTSFSLSHCSSVSLGLSTHSYRSSTLTSVPSLSLSLSVSLPLPVAISVGGIGPWYAPLHSIYLDCCCCFCCCPSLVMARKKEPGETACQLCYSISLVCYFLVDISPTHTSKQK